MQFRTVMAVTALVVTPVAVVGAQDLAAAAPASAAEIASASVTYPAPTFLRASTEDGKTITLSWRPGGDTRITGYIVYKNGAELTRTSGTAASVSGIAIDLSVRTTFSVAAIDADGNASPQSEPISVGSGPSPADTTAPTEPWDGSSYSTTATMTTLIWGASSDAVGVTGYIIYQDGVELTRVGKVVTARITFDPKRKTTFTVAAFDAAGNISPQSNPINVELVNDREAPTAPKDFLVFMNGASTSASLSWLAATDNVGVTEYIVYKDGVEAARTTSRSMQLPLDPSKATTLTVAAVDAAGNVSATSNAVTVQQAGTKAPSVPTNLHVTGVNGDLVTLAWDVSTDDSVVSYLVYKDGVRVQRVFDPTATVQFAGTAKFTVAATDLAGNVSVMTAPVSATVR